MKKIYLWISFCLLLCVGLMPFPLRAQAKTHEAPMMAIVIDDFGLDRGGIDEMLNIKVPLTCAIMPLLEFSEQDATQAHAHGHEVIMHMPMEACVYMDPQVYGNIMIGNYDDRATVFEKLDRAYKSIPYANGLNMHIGSGTCEHLDVMQSVYAWAKKNNTHFLDSRTSIHDVCDKAAESENVPYIKRDVFLEPHGMRGYENAKQFLRKCAEIAHRDGYAIAIGHVGVEGGAETARAISDMLFELEHMGVEIVPLSTITEAICSGKLQAKPANA